MKWTVDYRTEKSNLQLVVNQTKFLEKQLQESRELLLKSEIINSKLVEKLEKLKKAALEAHEEQLRETIEQEEIIESLLEENKALKKLLMPTNLLDLGLKSTDLESLMKEGTAAIKGRKIDKKVSEQSLD